MPAGPHAGGMRQAITAGDDTPQTPPDSRAAQPGVVVRAGSPAALLAVIPHLLGFMPEASVVVIGLTPPRDASGSRSGMTCPTRPMRISSPTSPGMRPASSAHSG